MSDWYDENDEPLGRWIDCTEAEYEAIKFDAGIDWQVFASRTDVGRECSCGRYSNRLIYTEWGRRGDPAPLVACDDRWDFRGDRRHTHMKFVSSVAARGGTDE